MMIWNPRRECMSRDEIETLQWERLQKTIKNVYEHNAHYRAKMDAIGMEPGDHLGVWARNIPDWLTFMYATAKIGVVMVTVNPVYKSHELDYVLKQFPEQMAFDILDLGVGSGAIILSILA